MLLLCVKRKTRNLIQHFIYGLARGNLYKKDDKKTLEFSGPLVISSSEKFFKNDDGLKAGKNRRKKKSALAESLKINLSLTVVCTELKESILLYLDYKLVT